MHEEAIPIFLKTFSVVVSATTGNIDSIAFLLAVTVDCWDK